MTEETTVSLGYFAGASESFALTTSFGKYGGDWKLNILEIGLLKIMNGDAVDWYHRAQRDYDSGYLADAANDLLIGEQLLRPAGDLLHYEKGKGTHRYRPAPLGCHHPTLSLPHDGQRGPDKTQRIPHLRL